MGRLSDFFKPAIFFAPYLLQVGDEIERLASAAVLILAEIHLSFQRLKGAGAPTHPRGRFNHHGAFTVAHRSIQTGRPET